MGFGLLWSIQRNEMVVMSLPRWWTWYLNWARGDWRRRTASFFVDYLSAVAVVWCVCVRGYRCFSAQKLGRRDKVPRVATERRFCPGFCHVLEQMNCHAPLFVTVWVTDKASLFSREASQANIIISEKDGGNDLSFSLCFCTVGLAKRFGPTRQGHKKGHKIHHHQDR